jgi:hypothetical protein
MLACKCFDHRFICILSRDGCQGKECVQNSGIKLVFIIFEIVLNLTQTVKT